MSKVAVVYWSGTGNTEQMAYAVADGVKGKGAEAAMLQAADFNASMMDDYDTIAFGCPAMGSEVLEESEFQPMFDACESVICNETPDDERLNQCRALGEALA